MFILLIISIGLHISPNPIAGRVGENIPFDVIVINKEGERIETRVEFDVVPPDLGRISGSKFIPKRDGKGILKCKTKVDGTIIKGYAYIHIANFKKAKIIPNSAIVQPGEEIIFKVKNGKPLKWKVIPEQLGDISDGRFKARKPGMGRIVVILDNKKILSAFLRVKGLTEPLKITPQFIRIKTGKKIQFSIKERKEVKWNIKPEDIGAIDENGLFYAKSPGKAVVTASIKEGEVIRIGRAVVVISGKLKVRVIPEKVTLHPGERTRFQIKIDSDKTVRDIPILWKVIPKRCGIIRKDGTFYAGRFPINGRVVAIIPDRFGGGAGSARISIVPKIEREITITPSLRELQIGEEQVFRINENIPIHWKVIPEDLGVISQDGRFRARKGGSGFIIAEPVENINIKPGKAFVLVSKISNIILSIPLTDNKLIEGFSTPVNISPVVGDYGVIWQVVPKQAGRIIRRDLKRWKFYAYLLPEGTTEQPVTIYAILHKDRKILGWGSVKMTITKRKD